MQTTTETTAAPWPAGHAAPTTTAVVRFWLYENWTAEKRAMLHRAACRFCNDGRGVHPGSTERNGRWHGPFPTEAEALAYAGRLGRGTPRRCSFCTP